MPNPLTTTELRDRLKRRILGPEGQGHRAFLLEEVELASRRADAISIGLWASRGQLVEGYELKSNRADWVREYEDHTKAAPTMAICDRFWLVTNPDVLLPGELPEPWGLLLSNGRGRNLVVAKEAPRLRKKTEFSINREALCRLLRRIQDSGIDERAELFEEARQEAAKRVDFDRKHLELQVEHAEGGLRRHREGWEAFHRALGLEPWKWHPEAEDLALIGKIAAALRDGEEALERLHNQVRRLEGNASDLSGRLNDILGELSARIYGKGQAV